MATILDNLEGKRRIIKLSTEDVISVVLEYQRIIPRGVSYNEVVDILGDSVIFIPEDI